LPKAEVLRFEARGEFNRFDPMEIVATRAEVQTLFAKLQLPYYVFPEDRRNPIRMVDEMPLKWAINGPAKLVAGKALKNEFFTYQLGLCAPTAGFRDVRVTFTDLKSSNDFITRKGMRCFNHGGTDQAGRPFTRFITVQPGSIQALWCGVQVPKDAKPGVYKGTVTVEPAGAPKTVIPVELTVGTTVLADSGDSEPWRGSRLRWLDSTLGSDDNIVAPYTALELKGKTVKCLGRQVTMGASGLPASVLAGGNEVLAKPLGFDLTTGGSKLAFTPKPTKFTKKTPGTICWESVSDADKASMKVKGTMEFDGHLSFAVEITAKKDLALDDISLVLPFTKQASTYLMGIGRTGGTRPPDYTWKWTGPYDSFWMGDVKAGMHVELRGGTYNGPLLNLYHPAPPKTWSNDGKGGVQVSGPEQATAKAFTGARNLKAGEKLQFEFALLVTPVKTVDWNKHFSTRYYHGFPPLPDESAYKAGVNVINLHHASNYNPYINYPLAAADILKPLIAKNHARGVKTKIYFTIRELTNHTTEFWALRSLGDEVLADGGGGGAPWLREHVVDHYEPAWVSAIPGDEIDAAVTTSGESRWFNFYVEGLQWMCKNVGIDGLYLDDVAYDRTTLKRMRKVMERTRPGSMIDLHSNTGFSIGPANQYAEFLPYVDRIWFGESFNYEAMTPDQWLCEVSGIPFGVGGEMLFHGGNPWRGTLYGMTNRLGWETDGIHCDPKPVWKIWDAFGIAESKMIGYWSASCPVRTNNPQVLATVYVKKGKALVCLASWAKAKVDVKLTIDWKALGISPSGARLTALESTGFQPTAKFAPGSIIPVEPGKGWMLVLE